jgi:1-acyl-sn-glycerol-3-phosphate acyltransferase
MKALLYLPRSLLFTIFLIVTILAFGLATSVTVWTRGRRQGYKVAASWSRVVLWMLKHLCKLDFRVHGQENIPAVPSVVYIKHSSTWETMAQMLVFPEQSWVLKKEIRWIPLVGTGVDALNSIAIDRKAGHKAVQQVIQQGKERLAQGYYVMIFPEGTRTPIGEQRRYGASGALLAVEAGVPLVPVTHNAGYFWPRRSWIKWPGTIDLVIGEPISTAGKTAQQVNQQARDWIEGTLEKLPRRGV